MDRILVVAYSYTGSSRRLASWLSAQHGWPVAEISEARPREGLAGLWRCLLDALLDRLPEIKRTGLALQDYDAVVLVAPIWFNRLASPMRSFIATYRDRLPSVVLLSVMGKRGASLAEVDLKRLTGHQPILSEVFTAQEVEEARDTPRLPALADAVRNAVRSIARSTEPGGRSALSA